jgi:adenylate cyclase
MNPTSNSWSDSGSVTRSARAKFELRFARHGEEALGAFADARNRSDAAHVNMPIMDGLAVLSVLCERRASVRAIIVSAYGDMANIRTATNRGAFDFVTKPVDLNDLEITIRKTLDEIGRVRVLDRRRAAAERAGANLARYFSVGMSINCETRVLCAMQRQLTLDGIAQFVSG